ARPPTTARHAAERSPARAASALRARRFEAGFLRKEARSCWPRPHCRCSPDQRSCSIRLSWLRVLHPLMPAARVRNSVAPSTRPYDSTVRSRSMTFPSASLNSHCDGSRLVVPVCSNAFSMTFFIFQCTFASTDVGTVFTTTVRVTWFLSFPPPLPTLLPFATTSFCAALIIHSPCSLTPLSCVPQLQTGRPVLAVRHSLAHADMRARWQLLSFGQRGAA